jgi:hypothetical protein
MMTAERGAEMILSDAKREPARAAAA